MDEWVGNREADRQIGRQVGAKQRTRDKKEVGRDNRHQERPGLAGLKQVTKPRCIIIPIRYTTGQVRGANVALISGESVSSVS